MTVTTVVLVQPVTSVYVMVVVLVTETLPAVTIPESVPIVATSVLLLLHVPPAVPSLRILVSPEQIVVLPVIARGSGFTVTDIDRLQPVGSISVIVALPPGANPVMTPDKEPIDAMEGALLLHVPPPVLSVNAIVRPTHTAFGPIMVPGNGLTVTVVAAEQPASV